MLIMRYILLIAIFALNLHLSAQEITITDQKTLGGNNTESLGDFMLLDDGTMLAFGRTLSSTSGDLTTSTNGDYDGWLIKLNADLSLQWQLNFGGSLTDYAEVIVETSDGNFLLGFSSSSSISGNKTVNTNGDLDYWIVKVDAAGTILWQATYGGADSEELLGIKELSDGSFILAGHSRSNISGDKTENSYGSWDYWVVKISSTGTVVWETTIGGDSFDKLYDLEVLTNGQIVLCGHSYSDISGNKTTPSFGEEDVWLVWLDEDGDFIQEEVFGGTNSELFPSLINTPGGLYISCSSISDQSGLKSENSVGGTDYWICKISHSGNLIWDKTIGGSQNESSGKIVLTADYQIVVQGSSFSDVSGVKTENSNGFSDYWLVGLDTSGNFVWDKTIGGSGYDTGIGVIEKADNNYILFGYSDSNISGDKDEVCRGAEDYWIVEVSSNVGIGEQNSHQITLFPNPTSEGFRLNQAVNSLTIVTLDGRVISVIEKYNGEFISTENFPGGIYFVQFEVDGIYYSKKVVVR